MKGVGFGLLGAAGALIALAVASGAHADVAGAAGAGAIVAATAGILLVAEPTIVPGTESRYATPSERFYHRTDFRLTPLGRERILSTLDRLDRRAGRPSDPQARGDELAALLASPPDRFRAYVRERIERLESHAT
jgi:hypothetical protein